MSLLSDWTGVNWEIGIGSSSNDAIGQAYINEKKKQADETEAFFNANVNNVESSLYADLYREYQVMKTSGNYAGLPALMDKFKLGIEKASATGAAGKASQERLLGKTLLLGGGDRYEQLLTKESLSLQQEPDFKKKGSLLTEDTIMATNKKALV